MSEHRSSEHQRSEPMDQRDLDVLGDLVDIYDRLDPMPEMLPEVVLFGLEISDLDAEVARLVGSEMSLAERRRHPIRGCTRSG